MLPALPYYPTHASAAGLIVVGAIVGLISGMLGIGGGVLVIPLLVFFFQFPHERAVGTSLGLLLPPIGIFAVAQYWRAGFVDVRAASIMAVMFALGAWAGSWAVTHHWVPAKALRVGFAFFLIYVAANMLFRSEPHVWAVVRALLLAVIFGFTYLLMHLIGRRWERTVSTRDEYLQRVGAPVSPDYEI